MKRRFNIVVARTDGGVEVHPLKEWLRCGCILSTCHPVWTRQTARHTNCSTRFVSMDGVSRNYATKFAL